MLGSLPRIVIAVVCLSAGFAAGQWLPREELPPRIEYREAQSTALDVAAKSQETETAKASAEQTIPASTTSKKTTRFHPPTCAAPAPSLATGGACPVCPACPTQGPIAEVEESTTHTGPGKLTLSVDTSKSSDSEAKLGLLDKSKRDLDQRPADQPWLHLAVGPSFKLTDPKESIGALIQLEARLGKVAIVPGLDLQPMNAKESRGSIALKVPLR